MRLALAGKPGSESQIQVSRTGTSRARGLIAPVAEPSLELDTVLVGDCIWSDSRGATVALREVDQAIRQAHAATVDKAKAVQG